jgi:hypothetical protein
MPSFRRRPLSGSEELFRPTGEQAEDAGEPVELTAEEVRWLLEGLSALRFPERARSRLTIEQVEGLGRLQEKLRSYAE